MLRVLIESNAPPQRRRGGAVVSVGVHTAVIVAVVVATASARAGPSPPVVATDPRPVYVTPQPVETPPGAAPATPPSQRRTEWAERVGPTHRVTFDAVRPPAPSSLGEIDPRSLLRLDTVGPGSSLGRPSAERLGLPVGDQPATIATVDRPASLLAPPRPRYPEELRRAGVTGHVIVRFVVDTLGRLEAGSVVVRESSHDLFEQAVRDILPALRFAAAEVGRRKVRMLVELPFEFRLGR